MGRKKINPRRGRFDKTPNAHNEAGSCRHDGCQRTVLPYTGGFFKGQLLCDLHFEQEKAETGWGGVRPRQGKKPSLNDTKKITFNLEKKQIDQLGKWAREKDFGLSEAARTLFSRGLADNETI